MSVALPDKLPEQGTRKRVFTVPLAGTLRTVLKWLSSWEIYPILLVAGFLRLYQLNASEFDGDQAAIFSLAREAVHAGLWPIISNRASIGIENPPAVIYLLMIPAALSANPLWAAIMVGLFNTVAVFLTYLFTRRYYGRFAGIIAALLYAAAAKPLNYSRFIWQQNMLAPFIILFMFALYWGVVERRRGWFFPAVLLLGIAYQLHETSTLLVIPLLAAVVLAPGTLRWRDLALALASLLLIFAPYIFWEFSSKFADVSTLLNVAKLRSHIDGEAIYLYAFFLSPNGFGFYYQVPADPTSILRLFGPILSWLRHLLWLLVGAGLVMAATLVLKPRTSLLRNWWADFRADPYRCALALLLAWQVVPVLLLSRHSLPLYPYYLLIFMPGPYILIGLFVVKVVKWASRREFYWRALRYSMYAITVFVVLAQIATCTATLLDSVDGTYKHGPIFNDLGSLEDAVGAADHLARQQHLNRVYITTDAYTETALDYLAGQMQTPSILFDDTRCLVLPAVSDGPAVLLASPYAQLTLALLRQYATATLVDQPARLGAPAFQLYIVRSRAAPPQVSGPGTFVDNLRLLNLQRRHLNAAGASLWWVSRWNMLRSAQPGARTTYNYAMTAFASTNTYPRRSLCTLTAMHPGDQLLVAFALPGNFSTPALVTVEGEFYATTPYSPSFGPLHLETDRTQVSLRIVLLTIQDKDRIRVPLS